MIRRSAALFFVKDGLLFRKDELIKEGKQWIVDEENQLKVMRSCHDEYTLYLIYSSFLRAGGPGHDHFGRDKTLHKA